MLNSSSCFSFTIIEGPGYHILWWFQICKFQGGLKLCVPSGDMVHPSLVTWMWTVFMTGVSSRVPSTKSAAVSSCEHQKLSNLLRMHTQPHKHLASLPGHSRILSRSCESPQLLDKIWEWPGNEGNIYASPTNSHSRKTLIHWVWHFTRAQSWQSFVIEYKK